MLPPRAILAAVDFSEPSRAALAMAARLAQQCGAALHVLHAQDPLLQAAASDAQIDLMGETHQELQQFIDATPPASTLTTCRDVVTGTPVTAILGVAKREGADLIVLGTHGLSGAGRLLFGSVTEGVLLRADRSVLVVPDSWTPPDPDIPGLAGCGPIVVGIDFSEPSLVAAAAAAALAEVLKTSVEALHVVPNLPVPQRWQPHAVRLSDQRADEARRELARLMEGVRSPVRITPRVEQGNVEEQLAAGAVDIGSRHPLLLLGRRSSRSHDRPPGATAQRVARLARVPVLMHEP